MVQMHGKHVRKKHSPSKPQGYLRGLLGCSRLCAPWLLALTFRIGRNSFSRSAFSSSLLSVLHSPSWLVYV